MAPTVSRASPAGSGPPRPAAPRSPQQQRRVLLKFSSVRSGSIALTTTAVNRFSHHERGHQDVADEEITRSDARSGPPARCRAMPRRSSPGTGVNSESPRSPKYCGDGARRARWPGPLRAYRTRLRAAAMMDSIAGIAARRPLGHLLHSRHGGDQAAGPAGSAGRPRRKTARPRPGPGIADDQQVEHAPRVAEELPAVGVDAQAELDDEDAEHGPVEADRRPPPALAMKVNQEVSRPGVIALNTMTAMMPRWKRFDSTNVATCSRLVTTCSCAGTAMSEAPYGIGGGQVGRPAADEPRRPPGIARIRSTAAMVNLARAGSVMARTGDQGQDSGDDGTAFGPPGPGSLAPPSLFWPSSRSAWSASSPPYRPGPGGGGGRTKYYIVRKPANGQKEFLFAIAVKTLGRRSPPGRRSSSSAGTGASRAVDG